MHGRDARATRARTHGMLGNRGIVHGLSYGAHLTLLGLTGFYPDLA